MSREERGEALADTVQQVRIVTPFNEFTIWNVQSSNGTPYNVNQRVDDSWICNCADFYFNQSLTETHKCKHIYAVEFWSNYENEKDNGDS